ncbi:MAG: hypothetical protein UU98_C0006G0014 [Parcubacteria group bacterium GW2011_GWD2_42_14]|nr:MAG: hypothetical protein UU98_C0006G0014 [Parcubacteria group bacterium GW2011_GWD2_42_14]
MGGRVELHTAIIFAGHDDRHICRFVVARVYMQRIV